MRRCITDLALGLVLALGSAGAEAARGQATAANDGISVHGVGEQIAKPNLVEIDLFVAGKAELTGDALVKFRDAKKRLLEAIGKLNLPNLTTAERALTVTAGTPLDQQQRIINGMPQLPVKTQIEVTSTIRRQLKDVSEVPTAADKSVSQRTRYTAQDAGVTVGPSPAEVMRNARYGNYMTNTSAVRFVVTDIEAIREKAYEQAVADARSRAGRLAKLNHVQLGSAQGVQELQVAGDAHGSNTTVNAYVYYGMGQQSTAPEEIGDPRIVSSTASGIPVQVKLLVRFGIRPNEPATAQN